MKTSNGNGARIIRFDWAIKNILRDKANFDILEGFLTALLREEVRVLGLLDTESNQEADHLKYNRVDIMVQDSHGRHIIVEVQNERERDYLHRLLFGTSKVIIDTVALGQSYDEIAKVISISILYFNLGSGDDYVYYGKTSFHGLHTQRPLRFRQREKLQERYVLREVNIEKEIFPEYYLIQVERFEDEVEAPLDEWIYMLKHEVVRDDFTAKHIDKAREKLSLLKMDETERRRYEKYMMNIVIERDVMETAYHDGREKGLKEGLDEGEKKGIEEGKKEGIKEGIKEGERKKAVESACQMLRDGLSPEVIAKYTGLTIAEIMALQE